MSTFPQVLRDYQIQEVTNLCVNAGFRRDDLAWITGDDPNFKPYFGALRGSPGYDVLAIKKTPYYFAFGGASNEDRASPLHHQFHAVIPEKDWTQRFGSVRQWLQEAQADLAYPDVWNGSAQALGDLFSKEQLGVFANALTRRGFALSRFEWRRDGLRAIVTLLHSTCAFSLEPVTNFISPPPPQRPVYKGTFSPGSHVRTEEFNLLPWIRVKDKIEEWSAAVAEDDPERLRYFSVAEPDPPPYSLSRSPRLLSLHLEGIRHFESMSLDLSRSEQTLIIGPNGTGKSTLLRSLALALVPLPQAQHLLQSPGCSLVRNGIGRIELRYEATDGTVCIRELVVRREGNEEALTSSSDAMEPTLVVGFGSGRGMVGTTDVRGSAVASLFRYDTQLLSTELTMRRVQQVLGDEARFTRFTSALLGVLSDSDTDATLELSARHGLELHQGGQVFPFDAWADGFRLTTTLLANVVAWALEQEQPLEHLLDRGQLACEGTLLIDEIEHHLHPKLQSLILTRLADRFPRLRIVATTHSPLVVLGAAPEGVVSLHLEGGRSVVTESVPDFRAYSLLEVAESSRLFDAPVYAPEYEKKLARHRELLLLRQQRDLSALEISELSTLAKELMDEGAP